MWCFFSFFNSVTNRQTTKHYNRHFCCLVELFVCAIAALFFLLSLSFFYRTRFHSMLFIFFKELFGVEKGALRLRCWDRDVFFFFWILNFVVVADGVEPNSDVQMIVIILYRANIIHRKESGRQSPLYSFLFNFVIALLSVVVIVLLGGDWR